MLIITQKSRGLDRKGMICGDCWFIQLNIVRCISKQTKKLNKYFGCCRKIYNLCVQNKESSEFKNLRDKSVTKLPKETEYKYMSTERDKNLCYKGNTKLVYRQAKNDTNT